MWVIESGLGRQCGYLFHTVKRTLCSMVSLVCSIVNVSDGVEIDEEIPRTAPQV